MNSAQWSRTVKTGDRATDLMSQTRHWLLLLEYECFFVVVFYRSGHRAEEILIILTIVLQYHFQDTKYITDCVGGHRWTAV